MPTKGSALPELTPTCPAPANPPRYRRARPRPLTPDRYVGAELESPFAESAKSETAERAILANLKFTL
jgi:hypothetical protein